MRVMRRFATIVCLCLCIALFPWTSLLAAEEKIPAEKIQYLKGNLLFWYGDLEPAASDLKQVTQKADTLDLSTAVMAWLRLGQVYDLQGKRDEAISAYRETIAREARHHREGGSDPSRHQRPWRTSHVAGPGEEVARE